MNIEKQFYVVGSYDQPYMAHIIKTLLDQHSIACEVINELSNQIYPFANGGDFAVRVIANVEDKIKIDEILSSEFENGK